MRILTAVAILAATFFADMTLTKHLELKADAFHLYYFIALKANE